MVVEVVVHTACAAGGVVSQIDCILYPRRSWSYTCSCFFDLFTSEHQAKRNKKEKERGKVAKPQPYNDFDERAEESVEKGRGVRMK